MGFKKFRWSRVYESSEEELIDFLQARNIDSERVHMESGDVQPEQCNANIITIWCAEGSLMINTGTANTSLQPGDALRVAADTAYSLYPGIADCVYYLTT